MFQNWVSRCLELVTAAWPGTQQPSSLELEFWGGAGEDCGGFSPFSLLMCYSQCHTTETPSLGFPSPMTLGYSISSWEKRKEARSSEQQQISQKPRSCLSLPARTQWQQPGNASCFQSLCHPSWSLNPVNLGFLGGGHPSEPHGLLYDDELAEDREERRGYVTE